MIIMPTPAVHTRAPGLLVPGFKTNWENVGRKHGKVRFRLALVAADGYVIHRHFIDDPEDAEWLYRVVLGLVPTVHAPSWLPSPQDYPGSRFELATYTFLTTTGPGTWNKPGDWSNASNSVHCIGGGGGGYTGGASYGGGGGGGGAYAGSTNLTPGATVSYSVGVGGLTGTSTVATDTFWGSPVFVNSLIGAVAGGNASTVTGGSGGSSASCIGTTKYSGGAGGSVTTNNLGAAGGGAAGPNGAGGNGANGIANYGAGGGGANGGTNGGAGSGTYGGNGRLGSGGGRNGDSMTTSTVGTNGGGGGGGGHESDGDGNKCIGRAGGIDPVWDSTHGPEGGSGGGGWEGYYGGGGQAGGTPAYYGSGSGGSCGAGGVGSGAAPRGGKGIITVIYQPASVAFFKPAFP